MIGLIITLSIIYVISALIVFPVVISQLFTEFQEGTTIRDLIEVFFVGMFFTIVPLVNTIMAIDVLSDLPKNLSKWLDSIKFLDKRIGGKKNG